MTVSFNEVPNNVRTPFVFIEIDPSQAQTGPSIQTYRTLNVGQKLVAGTVPADEPYLATSSDEVGLKSGFGSILHGMAIAYFAANNVTEAWFQGLDDDGGATQSTFDLTVVGTATAPGTVFLYIAGRLIRVGVAVGDDQDAVAASIVAAIAASALEPELPVTASAALGVVTFTARNGGTQGNAIDVRLNFNQGEELPAGITATVAVGVSGATDPDVTNAIAALGDVQYNTVAVGLNDTTTIGLYETEFQDRFTATRQLDGQLFFGLKDTLSNLVTFGQGRNSPQSTVIGLEGALSSPWEWTASAMGIVARAGQADPARPFQTLPMPGVIGPAQAQEFTREERNTLLFDGIATIRPDDVGTMRIDRMITTSQTNAAGAASAAFLDVNTLLTLSYLRFDARTQFANTYSRSKLGNDGNRFGAGQTVVTPNTARAFFLGVFRAWENLALVEDFSQFEEDLIVERDTQDVNRLNVVLAPNLVNQLRVTGIAIRFIL